MYLISNFHFLEPKWCGRIFEHDGDDRKRGGWATLYDGAKLGINYDLNRKPIYVANDRLSAIHSYGGKNFKIVRFEISGHFFWSLKYWKERFHNFGISYASISQWTWRTV